MRESAGRGITSEWHATDLCTEPLKLLNLHEEDPPEAGGVPSAPDNSPALPEDIDPFGLTGVAEHADAWKVEPSGVDAPSESAVGRGRCTGTGRGNCQY